ncbi:hypothetical protein NDU88_003154 [Pleurodeles waltl]|uniref:Uncharacterized protein n=1 Tax=Pleurodeles waltl TaxID=8319 RepID=A0AAV7T4Q7_PLEWA|nr:hypothetical protein NDU88_003154 [Pleurodeles waltl]
MEKAETANVRDTTTYNEAPEGREVRHVPGGAWLNQSRTWDGVCSRPLEFPATLWAKSGAESRFSSPYDDHDGIGNPSGQIPEFLPRHQDNVDAIEVTGNPDIRVPKEIKSENGLGAGDVQEWEDAG